MSSDRRQRRAQAERRLACGEAWTDYDVVLDGIAGAPIVPWSVSVGFARTVRAMGLPRIRFHGLPHWHASVLMARGMNLVEVGARLGHASVAFTMATYGHLMPGPGRASADAIKDILGEGER